MAILIDNENFSGTNWSEVLTGVIANRLAAAKEEAWQIPELSSPLLGATE